MKIEQIIIILICITVVITLATINWLDTKKVSSIRRRVEKELSRKYPRQFKTLTESEFVGLPKNVGVTFASTAQQDSLLCFEWKGDDTMTSITHVRDMLTYVLEDLGYAHMIRRRETDEELYMSGPIGPLKITITQMNDGKKFRIRFQKKDV